MAMNLKGKKIPIIIPTDKYAYYHRINIIVIDSKNPSIISILHEFAHHLHGPNEKTACAWSTQLFKKCFPKSFAKLKWQDNLLVKDASTHNPNQE